MCGCPALPRNECPGLLHWFAAPYVHHLKYDRATGMIDVETMTFFLQQRCCLPIVTHHTHRPRTTPLADGAVVKFTSVWLTCAAVHLHL